MTASMSYDLFSLIRSLSCKTIIKADLLKDATNTLKLLKIDVNKWSNYVEVSKIKVELITENILKGHIRWVTETFMTSDKGVEIFWQTF
jgi:hypothetical protein